MNRVRSNEDIRQAIDIWFEKPEECIEIYDNISRWDVSKITDMSNLFKGRESFDEPIGNWDVSNVTNMNGMFAGASSFNQSIDSWNVSNVAVMRYMFAGASSFNQRICDWNVSNVTDMTGMFDFWINVFCKYEGVIKYY